MALTETKHHQVEQLVRELANYSRGLLSGEQMVQLIGTVAFGAYEAEYENLSGIAVQSGYAVRAATTHWSEGIHRYKDWRALAAKDKRTAPDRIKTLRRKIARLEAEIVECMIQADAIQHSLDGNIKRAWEEYEALSAEDRLWLADSSDPELPPAIREQDDPPYEAVMGGEMSPKRRAQLAALQALLGDGRGSHGK